jgi:hypothetical protein
VRGVFAILTLAVVGMIIADLAAHPQALTAGGNALHGLLVPTYQGVLGQKVS